MVPTLTAPGEVEPVPTSPDQRAKLNSKTAVVPFSSGTRSKGKTKNKTGTGSKSILPTDDDEKKSLTVGRYQFRKDGAGWECREIIGKGRSRKRAYLAHLSRNRYEQMQTRSESGEDLEEILLQWADEKREEKRSA